MQLDQFIEHIEKELPPAPPHWKKETYQQYTLNKSTIRLPVTHYYKVKEEDDNHTIEIQVMYYETHVKVVRIYTTAAHSSEEIENPIDYVDPNCVKKLRKVVQRTLKTALRIDSNPW